MTRTHMDHVFADAVEEELERLRPGRLRSAALLQQPAERRRALIVTAVVAVLLVAGSALVLRSVGVAAPVAAGGRGCAVRVAEFCARYTATASTGDGAAWTVDRHLALTFFRQKDGSISAGFDGPLNGQDTAVVAQGDLFSTGKAAAVGGVGCSRETTDCVEDQWLSDFLESRLTYSAASDGRLTLDSGSATITFTPQDQAPTADPTPVPTVDSDGTTTTATLTVTPTPPPSPTTAPPAPATTAPPTAPTTEQPTAAPTSSALIGPTSWRTRTDAEIEQLAASRGIANPIWIRQVELDRDCMAEHGFLYDPVSGQVPGIGDGMTAAEVAAYRIAMYGPDTDQPYDWRTAGCHGRSVHVTGQDGND